MPNGPSKATALEARASLDGLEEAGKQQELSDLPDKIVRVVVAPESVTGAIIVPEGSSPTEGRPISSESRPKLVSAIARGRQWLSEIEAGTATIDNSPNGKPAASATSTRTTHAMASRGRSVECRILIRWRQMYTANPSRLAAAGTAPAMMASF